MPGEYKQGAPDVCPDCCYERANCVCIEEEVHTWAGGATLNHAIMQVFKDDPHRSERVALMTRLDFICYFGVRGASVSSAVYREGRQSTPLHEMRSSMVEAAGRFRFLTREAPKHGWTTFYQGPPLQG